MATKILVSLTRRDRIESNESCSMNFNRVGVVSSLAGYSVAALQNGLLAKIFSLTQVLSRPIVRPASRLGRSVQSHRRFDSHLSGLTLSG